MPSALSSKAPDLARLPIVVNIRAISIAEGMRAGLSVAVIIALSEYLTFAPLREAALAALLTCICDPGGPIRRRIPAPHSPGSTAKRRSNWVACWRRCRSCHSITACPT
jgi:hypothetical protein